MFATALIFRILSALECSNTFLMPILRDNTAHRELLVEIGTVLKLRTTHIPPEGRRQRYECVMFEAEKQPSFL
jgi:hypothetical protein